MTIPGAVPLDAHLSKSRNGARVNYENAVTQVDDGNYGSGWFGNQRPLFYVINSDLKIVIQS